MKHFISTVILAFSLTMGAYAQETIVTMATEKAAGEIVNIVLAWTGEGTITFNGAMLNNGYDHINEITVPANQTIELVATGNAELLILGCDNQRITSLDVTSCIGLQELYCNDNLLTKLNVTQCKALIKLGCDNNNFTELDLTHCTALTDLACQNISLESLDVTQCPALLYLSCPSNQLKSLDITQCSMLYTLRCNSRG